jgi:hypothetical protein
MPNTTQRYVALVGVHAGVGVSALLVVSLYLLAPGSRPATASPASGPLMAGYALAALRPGCNPGTTIGMQGPGGGAMGRTLVSNAGVFVNSSCPDALIFSGSGSLYTNGPAIEVVGGFEGVPCVAPDNPVGCNLYPEPITGALPVPQDPIVDTPAGQFDVAQMCPTPRNIAIEALDGVIEPGLYTSLDPGVAARDITMLPGVYCLQGGALQVRGNLTGTGVLLYLVDAPAMIDLVGTGAISLTAPTNATTNCLADPAQPICDYLNILVYKRTGVNTCAVDDLEISLTNYAPMDLQGLIYAPYSLVRLGGGDTLTVTGQILAGCVKFSGNGAAYINYDPDKPYRYVPPEPTPVPSASDSPEPTPSQTETDTPPPGGTTVSFPLVVK